MSSPQDDGSKNSMGISTYLTVSLLVGVLLYLINKKFGKTIKNWFVITEKWQLSTICNFSLYNYRLFASFWNRAMKEYHATMRDMKKSHFDSMLEHKSTDADLRKRSVLRVLEIGAGPGTIFIAYIKSV